MALSSFRRRACGDLRRSAPRGDLDRVVVVEPIEVQWLADQLKVTVPDGSQ